MSSTDNIFKFHEVIQLENPDGKSFEKIVEAGQPVLLKNCEFGDCMTKWNLDYFSELLGDEQIVIHEAQDSNLSFVCKNFKYRTCKFQDFVDVIRLTGPNKPNVYLRSTNSNPRAKKAADLGVDYPNLSQDLHPPDFIPYGRDNELYHSSILRVASANVQIWTHFDLYNNVLCQVIGTKRIVLIPPEDTRYLYIDGDKSKVNNFDDPYECIKQYPLIANAKLYKCTLKPGDCLYIPSMWWHNIKTIQENDLTKDYSIGFNIFWRDKDIENKSFYAENDVYGNKNIKPYDSALANLDKAKQHLSKLPSKYKSLYKVMLHEHFKRKFEIDDD